MKEHILKKTSTYLILTGVCVGIILIEVLVITIFDKMNKGEFVNDTIAEGVLFFICFPGIMVGLTGAIICSVRNKLKGKKQ
ncbi:MAG TPA: hypothetical protein VLQ91_18535 [Draconibacterium sp.]|nr:hypothetical protein [Draconibacterium sp.]